MANQRRLQERKMSKTITGMQSIQMNYPTQALAAAGYFVNCVVNLLSLTRKERKTQLLKVLLTPNP